jgi:hypothetical protein
VLLPPWNSVHLPYCCYQLYEIKKPKIGVTSSGVMFIMKIGPLVQTLKVEWPIFYLSKVKYAKIITSIIIET